MRSCDRGFFGAQIALRSINLLNPSLAPSHLSEDRTSFGHTRPSFIGSKRGLLDHAGPIPEPGLCARRASLETRPPSRAAALPGLGARHPTSCARSASACAPLPSLGLCPSRQEARPSNLEARSPGSRPTRRAARFGGEIVAVGGNSTRSRHPNECRPIARAVAPAFAAPTRRNVFHARHETADTNNTPSHPTNGIRRARRTAAPTQRRMIHANRAFIRTRGESARNGRRMNHANG